MPLEIELKPDYTLTDIQAAIHAACSMIPALSVTFEVASSPADECDAIWINNVVDGKNNILKVFIGKQNVPSPSPLFDDVKRPIIVIEPMSRRYKEGRYMVAMTLHEVGESIASFYLREVFRATYKPASGSGYNIEAKEGQSDGETKRPAA